LLVIDTRPRDDEGRYDLSSMTEIEQAIVQPIVLFNPEITLSRDKTTYEEGCLSVPGFYETVERFDYVEVKGLDANGAPIVLKTDGLIAICLQHEIDHLDGKLIIDRATPEERKAALVRYREAREAGAKPGQTSI
jgi:peptide deformylase